MVGFEWPWVSPFRCGANANRDLDLSVNLGMDNSKHGPSFVSGPKVGAFDIADGDPIDI